MTWGFKFLHRRRVGATGAERDPRSSIRGRDESRPYHFPRKSELSARVVALEAEIEILQQAFADMYQQSVYLGGLQSALVWIERRRESHISRQERYLEVLSDLGDLKNTLARFSNFVGATGSAKQIGADPSFGGSRPADDEDWR
jgi:hypothetical protein